MVPFGLDALQVSLLRWSVACHPEKAGNIVFNGAICVLGMVPLLVASKPLVHTALAGAVLCVLGTVLLASGIGIQVDESLLLDATLQGYSIGAGLIYKTTDLLNAVIFGDELPMGLVATPTRVLQCAALSFRWDDKESCTIRAIERRGARRDVIVHMSKAQLIKALQAAHAAGCRYVWCDTLCIPQAAYGSTDPTDILRQSALQALLPAMTGVYGGAKAVFVVETATGLKEGPGGYSSRTWTLQECVLNKNTMVVAYGGEYEVGAVPPVPVSDDERLMLSGAAETADCRLWHDMSTYTWVLAGDEERVAREVPAEARRSFAGFAGPRAAACANDKGIALGQPYFRVLFPSQMECERFFLELAWLCATDCAAVHQAVARGGPPAPMTLIDNTGWVEDGSMTGSAAPSRLLVGGVGQFGTGPQVRWQAELVSPPVVDEVTSESWTLCLADMGLPGRQFPVAFCSLPAEFPDGSAILHKLRTLTLREMDLLIGADRREALLLWG